MTASTSTTGARRRPTRAGYLVAAMLAIVGLGAAALWAATGVLDQVQRPETFTRAAAPGPLHVDLTRPGLHVVYVEAASDDVARATVVVIATSVTVLDPAGSQVPVRPYRKDLTYHHGGAVGKAVAVFDAPEAGTYRLTTIDAPGIPPMALAVGDDLAPGVVRAIALPALTALATLVLATLLAVATARRAGPPAQTPTHRDPTR